MWEKFAPWLAQGGFTSAVLYIGYRLHMDAIRAERGRADDNRLRAEAAEKRADLREDQIGILIGRRLPTVAAKED